MSTASTREADVTVYRGRRLLAAYLLLLVPLCLAAAAFTLVLDDPWLAALLMGLPLLFSAYLCLTAGWAEAIAHVEIRKDGFTLVFPSYRGVIPFWPAQHLQAEWSDVGELHRRLVRGILLRSRYDYLAYRILTKRGDARVIEVLPNRLFPAPSKGYHNIPVSEIMSVISRQSGRPIQDDGEIWGGTYWRNLILGAPRDLSDRGRP